MVARPHLFWQALFSGESDEGAHVITFRLTAFGTFPILRPIFHKMKNAGRVILEECKGQARRKLKAKDMLTAK